MPDASATLDVRFTLTIAAPMRELADRFHAATGIALDITFDPTTLLVQQIEAGAPADVAVLTQEEVARLAANGTLLADRTADVVRSFIGVGVQAGAPKPGIATVEEFRSAMLNARSVAYSQAGASGLYFASLLDRLDIADAVNARATIVPRGFTGERVVSGEADLAIQQVSELMNVPGVDIVGRFPEAIGRAAVFSAGVMAASTRPSEAARLVDFLCSPEVAPVMAAYGLEPLTRR